VVKQPKPWGLITAAAVVAALCLGVLAFAFVNAGAESPEGKRLQAEKIEGVQTATLPGGDHTPDDTTPVQYPTTPPMGGRHSPVWQDCGVYSQPIRPENAVHSMEHGAVWIAYRPDLPADQLDRLKADVAGKDYTLLSPQPDLPAPIVLTSWGRQLQVQSASDRRVAQFLTAFMQNPRLTPENGASCSGGRSDPA